MAITLYGIPIELRVPQNLTGYSESVDNQGSPAIYLLHIAAELFIKLAIWTPHLAVTRGA